MPANFFSDLDVIAAARTTSGLKAQKPQAGMQTASVAGG